MYALVLGGQWCFDVLKQIKLFEIMYINIYIYRFCSNLQIAIHGHFAVQMMVLCVVLVRFAGNLHPLSQDSHVMRFAVDLKFQMCPYVVSGGLDDYHYIVYV